jgi:hypothetical protein
LVKNNQFQTLPSNDFFKKLFLPQKNHQNNWMFRWFLNFYGNTHGKIRPVLKFQDVQNQLQYYQNVKNWAIFSYVTFYFWKSGVWGLEKPIVAIIARKHLIFKNKKSHMKNCSVFNILVIFELILNVLKLFSLKLV